MKPKKPEHLPETQQLRLASRWAAYCCMPLSCPLWPVEIVLGSAGDKTLLQIQFIGSRMMTVGLLPVWLCFMAGHILCHKCNESLA